MKHKNIPVFGQCTSYKGATQRRTSVDGDVNNTPVTEVIAGVSDKFTTYIPQI